MPLDDGRGCGPRSVQLAGVSTTDEVQAVCFKGHAYIDTVVVSHGVLLVANISAVVVDDRQG